MTIRTARVALVHGPERRQNLFNALDVIREDVEPRIRHQVMIKPNFLSSTNQLASTHADAVRGIMDFLLTVPNPPQEVIVAEGGNETNSGDALRNFGYHQLPDEYTIPIRLVDLNQESEWKETTILLADGSTTVVRMPRTVLDCPCTLSLAIPKTHDTCVVTLALKNMIMGTIYKPDRIKMHGFSSHAERVLPEEARAMNVNLIRLSRYLSPDISVIDGATGLQGNGPGGEDAVDLQIAAAGVDVFAVDAVVATAMGFEPLELGLLSYGEQLGLGVADLNRIDVLNSSIDSVQRAFKPHEKTPLQMQWQSPELTKHLMA